MGQTSELPPFEQSIAFVVLSAKEAVIAPIRAKLRDHDITEQQWRVLRIIHDRGETDATAIAEAGLLHAPSVTRILRELAQRGFILRQMDEEDRRRTIVTLSADGAAQIAQLSGHVAGLMQDYAQRFGPDRLDRLMEELRTLCAAIKGV